MSTCDCERCEAATEARHEDVATRVYGMWLRGELVDGKQLREAAAHVGELLAHGKNWTDPMKPSPAKVRDAARAWLTAYLKTRSER